MTTGCSSVVMLVAGLLGLSGGAASAADLLTAKVLPVEVALRAVATAMQACAADGYRVSVAIVDRGGVLRAQARADGAGPHTIGSSFKKAYTANSLGVATAVLANNVAEHPAIAGLANMDQSILLLAGGLPIKAGDEVIGGIGVGGAPGGDKDEACAAKGLGAIAEALQ